MKQYYGDILSRIQDEPKWWDENGVPRFEPFHPSRLACIYAGEAVLFTIACQGCGRQFEVAMRGHLLESGDELYRAMMDHRLHYGDPPNNRCCAAGPTMSSDPISVLSYWRRKSPGDWVEVKKFKGQSLR